MGKLQSWECKGCINTVEIMTPDGPATYCRPVIEGRHRTEWQGDTIICLDKIEGQIVIDGLKEATE